MLNKLLFKFNQDKIFRRKVLIIFSSLGLVILIFFALTRKSYNQYTFTSTPLKDSESFAQLMGEELYFYNGSTFLKKNITSGTEQILSSGQYLPYVSSLSWVGEKGVLLNFSSGFYYSKVEDILRSRGERINSDTKEKTWFLSFSNGELSVASNLGVTNNLSFYNTSEEKLYFITPQEELAEDGIDSGYQLNSYSFRSNESAIENTSLQTSGIKYLVACPERISRSTSFCLISLDKENQSQEKLFAYSKNKLTEIYSSKNVLKPTSNPNYYISLKTGEDKGSVKNGQQYDPEDLEGAGLFGEGMLIDLNSEKGTVFELGLDLSAGGTAFYLSQDNDFVLLDNLAANKNTKDGDPFVYASGKVEGQNASLKKYKAKSIGQSFDSLFIRNHGYSTNGAILMSDFEGNMVIVSSSQNNLSLDIAEQQIVSNKLSSCKSSSAISDIQYFDASRQFKLFWEDDSRLQLNISEFEKCLKGANISLYGYSLKYGIVDPITGKIVSE